MQRWVHTSIPREEEYNSRSEGRNVIPIQLPEEVN